MKKAINVPYVLIGTGAVIVLLGTFGCFATCRASTWMLKLYAMFLSLIFLIELVAAIVGLVFRHEIKDSFEHGYMQALKQYNTTGDPRSQAMDTIQKTLHCCGVNSYTDWGQSPYYKTSGIPPELLCQSRELYAGSPEGHGEGQGCHLHRWLHLQGDLSDGVSDGNCGRDFMWNRMFPACGDVPGLLPVPVHH
ncbi:unnamed protein product [Ranitomeya imitator]|uniref:Tetraspanin n=1 Tax=Ranitomeya imitator TaxID=111125 RepID=A0ABN9LI33_9NEOB|nr:unnamed protein product [Ranitomeya imitator]